MSRDLPLLSLLALFSLSGCQSSKQAAPKPNIVLVTIDTLRADRLGCYGYSKIETPNLDRLAKQGTLFENAVAQTPLTAPSHASMFTGQYPNVHKVRDTGGFVLQSSATLASILQREGWETAAFVGSSVLKRRFGFNQGFTVYDDDMSKNSERRASEVVDRATQWLDAQSGKPFFLWVHVFDPHLPYDPPSGFREKYADNPYDGEVAYTDQQLGRLFDHIAKKGDTLIAVLADHGESLSEHGEYAHGVFLYDTTLRIPLLLAGRGVPAGLRVKAQARTIDLMPTILDMNGIKVSEGVQGTSLVPALTGKPISTEPSYIESLFPKINMGWVELRGLRTNRWKYVRAPKPELYDLVQDPSETNNVIASHAAEAADLESKLRAISGETEKVEPAAVDQRTLAQLRSLGYLGGSTQKEYVLSGKGIDPKDRVEVLKLLHLAVNSGSPLPQRVEMLRKAVTLDPLNPTLYNNLGNLYAEAGQSAEAMKLYQSAVSKGIRTAWLDARLGHLYLQQGNKEEAIVHFERAAQMNPSDYDSLQNLAVVYRDMGKLADAERVLDWILKSGEEYAPAYNEMGMVVYQKGEKEKALGYFEKAAQLDAAFQLNLGRLYRINGDNARARAAFQSFLDNASSRPEYRQLIPQVRKELAAIP